MALKQGKHLCSQLSYLDKARSIKKNRLNVLLNSKLHNAKISTFMFNSSKCINCSFSDSDIVSGLKHATFAYKDDKLKSSNALTCLFHVLCLVKSKKSKHNIKHCGIFNAVKNLIFYLFNVKKNLIMFFLCMSVINRFSEVKRAQS